MKGNLLAFAKLESQVFLIITKNQDFCCRTYLLIKSYASKLISSRILGQGMSLLMILSKICCNKIEALDIRLCHMFTHA